MTTLKELILKRPCLKLEFLDVLLDFTSHEKVEVRNNAIRVTKTLHEVPDLNKPVEVSNLPGIFCQAASGYQSLRLKMESMLSVHPTARLVNFVWRVTKQIQVLKILWISKFQNQNVFQAILNNFYFGPPPTDLVLSRGSQHFRPSSFHISVFISE